MKRFFSGLQEMYKDEKKKPILFFGFYVVFFIILFSIISLTGDKEHLLQEYERGNSSSFQNAGILSNNYAFDYKVTLDEVLHDYYGKRYGSDLAFKYNNMDYYSNGEDFFVDNSPWVKCDKPILFYEFFSDEGLSTLISAASYVSKTEYESGELDYRYQISSNTINNLLYGVDTDYDEIPDEILLHTDKNGEINKITFKLDSWCTNFQKCERSLVIELNYEMFGNINKIDNPIE